MELKKYDEIELDIREILDVLISKWVWILVFTVGAALATGIASWFFLTPQYSSTSRLLVLSKSTSVTSLADIQVGTSLTADYTELIKSRPVIDNVITKLKLKDETYENFLTKLDVENPEDTRILSVTVRYDSPEMAKKVVDCLTEECRNSISNIMKQEQPNVIENGYVNPQKVSPNEVSNAILAGVLMMLFMCVFFTVKYIANDTIRSQDDIERYLEINTLALIPYDQEEGEKE